MGFKNHALFLWWWPTGPKISDNVTSLSQQCSFYFFYRKFFRKTFFHQNLGCFCNIRIALVVPSQRLVCPGLVCSQASQGLLDSTVCIFCCALEKMSLRLELQATIPCSCELTLVPVRGGWLETGFSGSDLARKGHKFSFLTHTKSLASGLGDKFLSPK